MTESIEIEIPCAVKPETVKNIFEHKLAQYSPYRCIVKLKKNDVECNVYTITTDDGAMAFYHCGVITAGIMAALKNGKRIEA